MESKEGRTVFGLSGKRVESSPEAERINLSSKDIQLNKKRNTMKTMTDDLLDNFLIAILEDEESMEDMNNLLSEQGIRWNLESLQGGLIESVSMKKLITALMEIASYDQEDRNVLNDQLENPMFVRDLCNYFSSKRDEIVRSKNRNRNKMKDLVPEIEEIKKDTPVLIQGVLFEK